VVEEDSDEDDEEKVGTLIEIPPAEAELDEDDDEDSELAGAVHCHPLSSTCGLETVTGAVH